MIRNLCSDELQPKRERWSCLALLQDFPLKLLKKKNVRLAILRIFYIDQICSVNIGLFFAFLNGLHP